MLIQIFNIFYYQWGFHVLDVEFVKSLIYIILRLQMALHNI